MFSRRKQAVLALLIGASLSCSSYWHHTHRPVYYPDGWPLPYLNAPGFATAGEIRGWDGLPDIIEAESSDWRDFGPYDNDPPGTPVNQLRDWRIGFDTALSFPEVEQHIENCLAGHNWRASRHNSVNQYFSENNCWRIILVENEPGILLLDNRSCLGPGYLRAYGWQLSINEYRSPIDYGMVHKAVSLD